jgi:hypothetical protein
MVNLHLTGYECLGQWNQLYRLMSDCTMSAVMPEAIGRVRGFENQNLTLCLEMKSMGDYTQLVTGKCAYPPGTAVALEAFNASFTGTDNNSSSASVNPPSATDADTSSKYAKELLRKRQVFEFIRRDGSIHKSLLPGYVPSTISSEAMVTGQLSSKSVLAAAQEATVDVAGNAK